MERVQKQRRKRRAGTLTAQKRNLLVREKDCPYMDPRAGPARKGDRSMEICSFLVFRCCFGIFVLVLTVLPSAILYFFQYLYRLATPCWNRTGLQLNFGLNIRAFVRVELAAGFLLKNGKSQISIHHKKHAKWQWPELHIYQDIQAA